MASLTQKSVFAYSARLNFLGYLPELLSRRSAAGAVTYPFNQNPSIKDVIEACGVPHTEVDLILTEQGSVDFSYQLQDRDQVRVYPPRHGEVPAGTRHLAETSLDEPRFILDVHLGKLTRKLRLLGFDCRYRNDFADEQIVELALSEKRTVLTRDRGLLKYARLKSGLLIRYERDLEQAAQVLNRYALWGQIAFLKRCVCCNGLLLTVAKAQISADLPPRTALYCSEFWRCRDCLQIYWQGAHFHNLDEWLRKLRALQLINGRSG